MLAIQKIKLGSTWVCLALAAFILVGCSSSSSQNKRVYDRYAALVAERNRSNQSEATAPPSSAPRSPDKSLSRSPIQSSSTTQTGTPKKTVGKKSTTNPVAPTPAPPVQVIAPAPVMPVEAPASVSEAVPAPVVPAPVQPPKTSPPATPASPADSVTGYSLKVGDGIQIFLRGIPAPDAIEDIIDEVGMIALPLINDVKAAGLTASELERSIRKIYLDKDIYRNISVNVVVPTRYYFIQGEIRAPGRFQIMSATRLSQAIAGAGGYTEYASGKVLVKRAGQIYKIIKNARRLERKPDDDIMLEPDDIIEVKRSLW
jgi:protein involved in polysaccharide export with SLBB domain